jgi:hypothetical protein
VNIKEVGQVDGYELAVRDVLYFPVPGGNFEVCGERILRLTLTMVRHLTQ